MHIGVFVLDCDWQGNVCVLIEQLEMVKIQLQSIVRKDFQSDQEWNF